MVTENLAEVERRVQAACARAGRSRDEVTLIAVSKTKPVSLIEELLPGGTRDFGENKVQELCERLNSSEAGSTPGCCREDVLSPLLLQKPEAEQCESTAPPSPSQQGFSPGWLGTHFVD